MIEMIMEQASVVRKEWSAVCDSVIHDKPKFIKRTRDEMLFSSLETVKEFLRAYTFSAEKIMEDDGSVTLSLNEIDLIENGPDESAARKALGNAILEYALEYYEEYDLYSRSLNRKNHIPYVFKALITDDADKIGESIKCQSGKN